VGYYSRILSRCDQVPELPDLERAIRGFPTVELTVEDGRHGDWTTLLLSHSGGPAISLIERTILWQFSEAGDGAWWMAVRRDGRWINFQMDLASHTQRSAFFRGEVPDGLKSSDGGSDRGVD